MGVPAGVWISAAVILVAITWITLWVTKKAYSRKWDEPDQ
ncbi:hypothetical protein DFQ01_13622 [Paenibacillus cellulosilyticus]|uniref:Uncharacterized protein n=1 Tax=Paenibacillus cellulosilyticus TaxID=375489 RepID=A0A2V2YGX0_9BACL|nr:hypothetical protein DFQ01_13622 [Paenibacillus cellulosilyticus]GMK42781.1 hypothetical protein PCCS19_58410 [Paenibacillus cellulosilyticus]